MGWTDAHRYYQLLRVVEDELDAGAGLRWDAERGEVFGTPERLRLALATRWQTLVHAQVDAWGLGGRAQLAALVAAHPGLVREVAPECAALGAPAPARPSRRAHLTRPRWAFAS